VGVALYSFGNAYLSDQTSASSSDVAVFRHSLKPNPLNDNPLLLHSLGDAGTPYSADFQTNSSGDVAVFTSVLALSGFDSAGRYEVFRYDATAGGDPRCVSCNPTGLAPTTDASLASNGLSLSDDGRVFFNTGEPLVQRDTDSKDDAYEWSDGRVELISSGQSQFDSGLLSVTHDGTDAFFFTREKLASGDQNGSLTRVYDARENGGFFVVPPPPSCAASDECHGPGSPAPGPPSINTNTQPGGNCAPAISSCGQPSSKRCRSGKVLRHGRCVARHPEKHHHKRTHAKRRGAK
jgi:hypothetical protein